MNRIDSGKNSNRRDFLGILLKGGFFAWILAIIYPFIIF